MKNRKYIAILSLLLALVMALTSCGGSGDPGEGDTPVTAEAKFASFVNLVKYEDAPLMKVENMTETYGTAEYAYDDAVVFYNETKDKLNNLTQTVTLYSISEAKALLTITNAYPDEYGWENEFGHETHPEKRIVNAGILTENAIPFLLVEWEICTPIDPQTVKDQRLDESYEFSTSFDFYDIYGTLIASTSLDEEFLEDGLFVDSNLDFVHLCFGKTIAVFDAKTNKLVKTYNGDTEAAPILYDFSNEAYDYLLGVPNGITDDSFISKRTEIRVFDKKGNLVLNYLHGDLTTYCIPTVLDNGDILLQQLSYTDSPDFDYGIGEMRFNIDTFLLDVQTGKVSELKDFKYLLQGQIIFADAFAETFGDGFAATKDVRNVGSAVDLETKTECTLFFDNFGTVNYVFNGRLCYEMNSDKAPVVLDEKHVLVYLESDVAERAILGADGKVIAYVPDGATVLKDYVVTDEAIYDLDMKKIADLGYWNENYDSITPRAVFGNCIVFTATDTTNYDGSNPELTNYVIIYDAQQNEAATYSDTELYRFNTDHGSMGGYAVLRKEAHDGLFTYEIVNGKGDIIFTSTAVYDIEILSCIDSIVVNTNGIDDADETYLILEYTEPEFEDPENME